MEGSLNVLGVSVELFLAHNASLPNFALHSSLMPNSLNDITCTSLTFRTNEGGALGNATEGLAEVPSTANEWHLERMLVDVVLIIRGCEDLGLVDVVDSNCLKDLFFEVNSTARLAHNNR